MRASIGLSCVRAGANTPGRIEFWKTIDTEFRVTGEMSRESILKRAVQRKKGVRIVSRLDAPRICYGTRCRAVIVNGRE